MSYQQPPQGYPPQQQGGYPQQPQYQQPQYQAPAPPAASPLGNMGDNLALPGNLFILAAFALLAGVAVIAFAGILPASVYKYIYAIGNTLQSAGEVGIGISLVSGGFREKEHGNSVKITMLIVGAVLIIHGIPSMLGEALGALRNLR